MLLLLLVARGIRGRALRTHPSGHSRVYSRRAVLFLAGFLSKENLVTLPVMLVLAELILFRQDLKQLLARALTLGLMMYPPGTHVHGGDSLSSRTGK